MSSKIKIIYIGAFRFPNYDAAASRVLNNGKAFRELGNEVSFISWGGKYRESDLCEDGKYRVEGFEYVITNEIDSKGTFLQRVKAKYCRGKKTMNMLFSLRQKPDLIVTYNANNGWTKKMLKFCSTNKIKLANDITEWYANNELYFTDILPNYINMTRTQRKVKNKIVISSYLKEFYSESNNLIVPPLFDRVQKKWNLIIQDGQVKPFNGVTLIYAGNPVRKDCLNAVIQAVNLLANKGERIRFLIIGIDKKSYFNHFPKILNGKELHENIQFMGQVSQEIIPAYYNIADFMVLIRKPSRKNMVGFPTKFAESITVGIPVITNLTSDIGKYIENEKSGFIVEGYTTEDILTTLRDKVIPLDRKSIELMKKYTKNNNMLFDYRKYLQNIDLFLNSLQ